MRLSKSISYLSIFFFLEVDVSGSLNLRVTSSHHICRDSYTHSTLAIDLTTIRFSFYANKAPPKVFSYISTHLEFPRAGRHFSPPHCSKKFFSYLSNIEETIDELNWIIGSHSVGSDSLTAKHA